MTLLSLFMTSTGIFCFVPISQRLAESGIIPASSSWRFRKLPSILSPTPYARNKERMQFLPSGDDVGNAWSGLEERHQMPSPPIRIPLCSADNTLAIDQQLETRYLNEWNTGIGSPLGCSSPKPLLRSASYNTFYGHESTSFVSDTTLCNSCNTLLRQEIPPEHIPSVIRAFALFEAQDRLSDVDFNECDVAALINAFSMLRL